MHAVWYERHGAPHVVLHLGEMPTPDAGPGVASDLAPGDRTDRRTGASYLAAKTFESIQNKALVT
jgi:hypothetical protein